MKMKRIVASALALTMAMGLVACGGGSSSSSESKAGGEQAKGEKKGYSIDVILKTTASDYWKFVEAGCKDYAKDHPEVKVAVKGASSETDYDGQLNILETDLGSGEYDAFVIAPLQADIVKSKIAGTKYPIIAVDTKIEAPEVLTFVGTGNKAAAELGGKAAVEAAKKEGWKELKAICISGVQGDSTVNDRIAGYKAGIDAAGGQFLEGETQYANAVADQAVTCMEAIMQKHPEGIAMIVCNNDDIAIAAAKAASGNPAYKKTIFVGFDGIISACEAILQGKETLSVAQDAHGMGYKAVEAAVNALKGQKLEKFIDSGAKIIDKSNAEAREKELKGYLGK